MIYLDSGFVNNFLIVQYKESNRIALKRFEILKNERKAFISLHSLQEVAFVLGKLRMDIFQIEENILVLEKITNANYSMPEFIRAKYLVKKIGFQNINDCLHVAMAESYCD